MTKDLTTGNPLKLILQFSFPILLAMLFQQFYNLVDTMIVGKTLGANALAAVGSTGSLNFMVIGFCSGICAGFTIPMSQSFGARNESELKRFIGNSFWLCLVFAVVLTILTVILCKSILRVMNTPQEILDAAHSYIVIIFAGIPATFLYNMLSCMIRSVGDSKTPVLFLGLASGLNILLDILLITVVHMGVSGAAVATVTSQTVSGVLCLLYLKKKFPILQPSGEQWRLRSRYASKLCMMGIPMGLQYSVTAIGSIILQTAVNSLGTLYVAAVTAGSKLSLIFCCPFDALGTAIATYSGQNIGAGKPRRVRQGVNACMMLGAIYSVIALVLFFFAGKLLLTLFVDASNTEIIGHAWTFLICVSLFYVLLTGVNVYRFCIQGMGYSQIAVLAGAMEMLARTVTGIILVPLFGFAGVCAASPLAWIAANLFLIPAYLHYTGKLITQTEKSET
ncbi:MAG: MATE family efflux transporter [Eubacteriales bacterium]|nr:MATE family efflux transporter [Eubacteriales bacterium]